MGTGQKIFSRETGEYNGVAGITESEAYHLAKDKKMGRKGLEEGLRPAFDADELTGYRDKCITAFEKHTQKYIDSVSLSKINAGIAAYVKSSVTYSRELDVLKASLLYAFGTDFLTEKYDIADEGTKQIIKQGYFEDVSSYLTIDEIELIPREQILKYVNLARTYTRRYLGYFYKRYYLELEIDEVEIYRGIGNKKYNKAKRFTAKPDKLSVFMGLDTPHPYYESQILTSYTLNSNVAEQFMLDNKNTRRAKLHINLKLMMENMFSSFMVSTYFDQRNGDSQFEFLVLPNSNNLYISSRTLEDLYTEFTLSEYK